MLLWQVRRIIRRVDILITTDDPNCYTVEDSQYIIMKSNANVTISGSDTKYTIRVPENATNVRITLNNCSVLKEARSWKNAIELLSGSSTNITLEGTNNIQAGNESSAIRVAEGASLSIYGPGTLNASIKHAGAGAYSAVIGSQYQCSCGNITIYGGTINANSNNIYAAAIGTASWRNKEVTSNGTIALNGGTINANKIGGINTSANCTVTGSGAAIVNSSNINADTASFNGIVFNENTGTVYGNAVVDEILEISADMKLTIPDGATLTVTNTGTLTNNGTLTNYGTLTNKGTIIINDTFTNNGLIVNVDRGSVTGTVSGNQPVTTGTAFTITGSGLIYGQDYTYPADTGVLTILSDKAVTISGSTETDIIFVAKDVSANITLDGVSIDVSATSRKTAFEIETDSSGNVTVTLVGDNTLKSGEGCAGLQKNGSGVIIGTLTIQGGANGTGTLTATGGDGGAGIGGGYMGAAKNITIDSAIITAKGASGIGSGRNGDGVDGIQIINSTVKATGIDGAGIGGSDDSSLSNLIISKSTETATGGASGIGGGKGGSTYWGGDCTDVTIEDSVVVATGSGGAGIGTGNANEGFNRNGDGFSYCKDITITNSVVTAKGSVGAAGIGGGVMGKCENVEIYGSSVIAEGNGVPDIGWGKYYEDPNNPNEENTIYGRAVNATSSGNTVYPFTIANPTGAAVIIDGTEYAYANHDAADANNTNLYAYLTGEAHTVTIGEVTTEY